jgi:hypothetical protein
LVIATVALGDARNSTRRDGSIGQGALNISRSQARWQPIEITHFARRNPRKSKGMEATPDGKPAESQAGYKKNQAGGQPCRDPESFASSDETPPRPIGLRFFRCHAARKPLTIPESGEEIAIFGKKLRAVWQA